MYIFKGHQIQRFFLSLQLNNFEYRVRGNEERTDISLPLQVIRMYRNWIKDPHHHDGHKMDAYKTLQQCHSFLFCHTKSLQNIYGSLILFLHKTSHSHLNNQLWENSSTGGAGGPRHCPKLCFFKGSPLLFSACSISPPPQYKNITT